MEKMDRSHPAHVQGTKEGAEVLMGSSHRQGPEDCSIPKMLDPDGTPKAGSDGGPPSLHWACPGIPPWHLPTVARLGFSSFPLVSNNIPLAEL